MKEYEKLQKICNKLIENGWEIKSTEGNSCVAKKSFAEIEVYFEECMCHGGRISICEIGHNRGWVRIEHEEYDESLGIVDSETELLWEIENELIDTINKFYSHMTWCLCEIGEYEDKKEIKMYFRDEQQVLNRLLRGNKTNEDIYSLKNFVVDYPNEKCHLKITRIYKKAEFSWEQGRVWFELEKTDDNWKTSRKFEAYVSRFNK